MSKLPDLFREATIPFPTMRFSIDQNDNLATICDKLDQYFNSMIGCYSNNTHNRLWEIYYNDINCIEVENLACDDDTCAELEFNYENNDVRVKIDNILSMLPITSRVLKIHEIAIHAGQYLDRIETIGKQQTNRETKDSTFNLFTEASDALCERQILNKTLIVALFKEANTFFFTSKNKRKIFAFESAEKYKERLDMPATNYFRLEHKFEGDILTHETHNNIPLIVNETEIHNAQALKNNFQTYYQRQDVQNYISQHHPEAKI